MVTVKQNVYFDKSAAVDHLKGEDLVIDEAPPATPAPEPITANYAAPTPVIPMVGTPLIVNPPCQLCIQRPSQHIQDLI